MARLNDEAALPASDQPLLMPMVWTWRLARGSRFEVNGKAPLLVTRVALASLELVEAAAIDPASLWSGVREGGINPAKLFVEHIRANKTRGVAAVAARASMAAPDADRLIQKGLDKDIARISTELAWRSPDPADTRRAAAARYPILPDSSCQRV